VVLEGKTVDNPLRSFRFNASIVDRITGENSEYSKPVGCPDGALPVVRTGRYL
jgi:hypothetical protein